MSLSDLFRRLDALLELADVGVFTGDPDGTVRFMSPRAEGILGLAPGAGLGRTCREVLGAHMCAADCACRLTRADGAPRRDFLLHVVRPDGAQRDLLLGTVRLAVPGEDRSQVAVTIRDVTEAERLRRALRDRWSFRGLVTVSPRLKEVCALAREFAPWDVPVLLRGEPGTGKELLARAIHAESRRHAAPFVSLACGGRGPAFLGEWFGHAARAFPGAVRDRVGRLEAASGGTVFLDEVGDLPPEVQTGLARVMTQGLLSRLGDPRAIRVDLRFVVATNLDLAAAAAAGRFREDLLDRLSAAALDLPPLRDRREDVPVLLEHHLARLRAAGGRDVTGFSPEALHRLLAHDWPGNVRELENAVESAAMRARGPVILSSDLPPGVGRTPGESRRAGSRRSELDAALAAAGGHPGRAAALLGIHRTTLWRWLRIRS